MPVHVGAGDAGTDAVGAAAAGVATDTFVSCFTATPAIVSVPLPLTAVLLSKVVTVVAVAVAVVVTAAADDVGCSR